MASFNKINGFVEAVAEGGHDFRSDQLTIALTNTAHDSSWEILGQLTEISYTNLSSRNITTSDSSQTAGTYKLTLTDLVLTASGSVGPFRYIYIYNDTNALDALIGYYDYGSEVTLASGETFTINFDGSAGVLTIA